MCYYNVTNSVQLDINFKNNFKLQHLKEHKLYDDKKY